MSKSAEATREVISGRPKRPAVPPGSVLDTVQKGRVLRPRKCLVYGEPGVGKTTFATSSANPLVLQTEEGCNDLDVARLPVVETFAALRDALADIAANGKARGFDTLVVDTIDWIEPLIHAQVSAEHGNEPIADIPWHKGYYAAIDKWDWFLSELNKCRASGLSVVLVGHSRIRSLNLPDVDSFDQWTLRLHTSKGIDQPGTIFEWCDEVFLAFFQVELRATESGKGGQVTKRPIGGRRLMRCQPQPTAHAKNRLGMPEVCELKWSVYQEAINKAKELTNGNH